jgi:hypothetical protein
MMHFLNFLKEISQGHRRSLVMITVIGTLSVVVSLSFVWALKAIIDVASGDATGSLLHYSLFLIARFTPLSVPKSNRRISPAFPQENFSNSFGMINE